ncbi:MAG: FKBP-type peptidyl-prolyl cis-trans isomerase [Chitinophagales bacterium]
MNKVILVAIILSCTIFSTEAKSKCCKKNKKSDHKSCMVKDSIAPFSLKTNEDTVSYYLGAQIGGDMLHNNFVDINTDAFVQGMRDALKADSLKVDAETGASYTQAYFLRKQAERKAFEAAKEKQYWDSLATNPNIKTTSSGLRYEIIQDATGDKPTANDTVTVHYTGKLTNGEIFDSSVERGEPATFPLNAVIKGWTEGVQLMSVGSKYKFYIPGNLAYGEHGIPQAGIGPNATLVFDVELLGIHKAVPVQQVPTAPSNLNIQGQ